MSLYSSQHLPVFQYCQSLAAQAFLSTRVFANFACHLLTLGGAFASLSCKINSIVSSILEIAVTESCDIKASASSISVGFVVEGCSTMIGFEVFFCRIWYFLSPEHSIAYPGVVSVGGEDVIVILLK
jgi:hypothetical protein